jgi:serine/threonine protein kinase
MEVSDLERHGFLDISLNRDHTNLHEMLPTPRGIARLGIVQMIQGKPWRFLDRSLTRDDIIVGWYIKELYDEGTYGKIFKAYRAFVKRIPRAGPGGADGFMMASTVAQEVILKQTNPADKRTYMDESDIKAHVSEALLHVFAWNTLQRTILPWAVPRPYEMYGIYDASAGAWRSMSLCMDFVRGRKLNLFLTRHWNRATPAANAVSFLEILAQMACILYVLQRNMRLNHRDVKVNNILIRRRTPDTALVSLRMAGIEIQSPLELTLIDFGFACVGCAPPRPPMSAFHASSYFTHHEMCCKVGRDLAQLIFCIHCYFPLHVFLPYELYRDVRDWLQVPWAGGVADVLHGFEEDGTPRETRLASGPQYHQGIYEFLRRAEVDVPACEPVRLFRECYRLKTRYS